MKSYYILLGSIIFIIIILVVWYINKKNVSIINSNNSLIKCDSKNCPEADSQNVIYKLHVNYKPNRDKNFMIANNTSTEWSTNKGPKNIFIIRHGEKKNTEFALDCNGILRSTHIVELIYNLNELNYGISDIITANSYVSMHKEQTVTLSSWLLNIPLFIYGNDKEMLKPVEEMFTNPYFENKTILICWEHTCIQELVKTIIKVGTKIKGLQNYKFINPNGNDQLPYWNKYDYSSIFHFDENLKFNILKETKPTCFDPNNNISNDNTITYGQVQKCK